MGATDAYECRKQLDLNHNKGWKVHYDGIIVGGIPVGTTEFKQLTLDTTTRSIINFANEVAEVVCDSKNPSILFQILSSCVLPKIQYRGYTRRHTLVQEGLVK